MEKFRKLMWICGFVILSHTMLGVSSVSGHGALIVQQQHSVTGKVTDRNNLPLPGVTVVVKGTTQGTATNTDGEYSLTNIPDDATLVFSFVGMLTQEVFVGTQTSIDVVMESDFIGLEEVIAVGYGTMRRSDITGSVVRVDPAAYETQQTTNLVEMLSGTVAGFASNQGTQASGGGSMQIRGQNSLKASSSPLIVLDGIIFSGRIGDINPHDIESIDILKDASSAAIYGAQAASGVLIVTTKRGATEKPTVNFSAQYGLTGFTNFVGLRSSDELMHIRQDYWNDAGGREPHYYTDPRKLPADGVTLEDWMAFNPGVDDPTERWLRRLNLRQAEIDGYLAGTNTDWTKEIFKPGTRENYNLSVSGRSDVVSYYWSMGYLNNQGIAGGDGYGGHMAVYRPTGEGRSSDNYSTVLSRLNLDVDPTDYLNFGINLQFANRDESFELPNFTEIIRQRPALEKYEEDGSLKIFPDPDLNMQNPYVYPTLRERDRKQQNLLATLTGRVKLPLGFEYNLLFTNRFDRGKDFLFDPAITQMASGVGGYGYRQHSSTQEWSIDNILRWERVFADIHNFNFTFLYNAEKVETQWDIQRNSNFEVSEELGYHAVHAGETPVILNNDGVATATAIMGRMNYSFDGRYMLTATMRRDGYSAFGQENPYGYFPSIALGWAMSEEDFFNIDNISLLRFRLSWGRNGNRAIDRYAALSRLEVVKYSYSDDPGRAISGFYSSTMSNSQLRWETTSAYNIGIDFGLFRNRLNGNLEVYRNQTFDLLVDRSLPAIIGYAEVAANLGELQNQGLEFTLNSNNIDQRNIKWSSNFVFSLNRNKLISLYGDMIDILDEQGNVIGQREADDPTNEWFIGESIHRNWNYEVLGMYQPGDEEDAAVYNKKPGDFILRDVNGDGVLTALDDKVFQGYSTPRYRLGLNNNLIINNFEVSAFIRADLGHETSNGLHMHSAAAAYYVDQGNWYNVPYSTTTNVVDGYNRVDSTPTPGHAYYESRSFVRLQDLSIGYNLPGSMLQTYGIQRAKVYVSGRNLLTFTKWTHNDPESGGGLMPRYYNLGVNLTF